MSGKYRIQDYADLPGLDKINKAFYTEVTPVGLRCFLRCSSCDRNIHMDNMNQHWDEKHYTVICSVCNWNVDRSHYHRHVADECSGRVAYCRYCSLETTKGHVLKHEGQCGYSPHVRGKKLDLIGIPKNIQTKIPFYNQVCKTAREYSKVHRKEIDPSVAFDSSRELQKKYPGLLRNKPYGKVETQSDFEEDSLENNLFPEGKTARASKAIEHYMRSSDKLRDRVKIRTPTPSRLTSSSGSEFKPVKRVHFKSPIESARTSRDTSVDEKIHFNMLASSDSAVSSSQSSQFDHMRLRNLTVDDSVSTVEGEDYVDLYKLWNKTGETARKKTWKAEQRAKLADTIRTSFAIKNRQMAHAFGAKKNEHVLLGEMVGLKQRLRATELETSKTNVINQAIQLEKAADKLKLIPPESWPSFVDDVKKTRKIWPDLGFEAKDCVARSTDKEVAALTKKGKKLVEQLKDPGHYFTNIDTTLQSDERKKGRPFEKCDLCNEFIHVNLVERHRALCSEDHSSRPTSSVSLRSGRREKTSKIRKPTDHFYN